MNRLGDSLFPLTCAAGQVMKWDGLQWACANDAIGGGGGGGTVTSVAAGTGLQGSPNPITGAGVDQHRPGLPAAAGLQQRPGAEEQRRRRLGLRRRRRRARAR